MIRLKGVSKIYSRSESGIGPLDLTIDAGEWLTLLGPSGSGKSTLLRLLANLETPSAGELTRTFSLGETGFVFQEPALLPWKSALRNVMLPMELKGFGKQESQKKAQEMLELFRVGGLSHLKPSELSGGQKMRVSLARALVQDPKVLFLDEPFAALDEPIRIELGLELRSIFNSKPLTVLMVTHSITEAVWLSNRVVVLQGRPGQIVSDEVISTEAARPLLSRGTPEFLDQVDRYFHLLKEGANA